MLVTLVLLTALATAAITMTVTRSALFRPIRDAVAGIAWVHKLVTCPYCFSHWVAFGLVSAQYPHWDVMLILCWFAVVTLAAPAMWVIYKSIDALKLPPVQRANDDYHDDDDDDPPDGDDGEPQPAIDETKEWASLPLPARLAVVSTTRQSA